MQEIKNKIEAILFITGRFMDIKEIAKLSGVGSIGVVRDGLKELEKFYHANNNSLEILSEKGRFKLNIKRKYSHLTTNLLNDSELDRPTQETLAIIAYKNPVIQSDVIKIRGNTGYDHIKILKNEEFITAEKYGRTRLIKLTSKFFDYFNIIEDHLQSKFKEIENKINTDDIQQKLNKPEDQINQQITKEELIKDQIDSEKEEIQDEKKEIIKENETSPSGSICFED